MIALLDGDLICYRSAASAENEDVSIAISRVDNLVTQLLHETGAEEYKFFLTGSGNFRKQLDPLYKANRKDTPLPFHLESCREHAIVNWNAQVTDGCEADDALAMSQTEDTVVVSLDKDMLQVPGKHYQWSIQGTSHGKQWVKEAQWYTIGEFDGLTRFYTSALVGDRADNIIGVEGVGPKRASKALEGCSTEQELFDTCRALYSDDERMFLNLKMLWLWRYEGNIYCPKERGLINEDY